MVSERHAGGVRQRDVFARAVDDGVRVRVQRLSRNLGRDACGLLRTVQHGRAVPRLEPKDAITELLSLPLRHEHARQPHTELNARHEIPSYTTATTRTATAARTEGRHERADDSDR